MHIPRGRTYDVSKNNRPKAPFLNIDSKQQKTKQHQISTLNINLTPKQSNLQHPAPRPLLPFCGRDWPLLGCWIEPVGWWREDLIGVSDNLGVSLVHACARHAELPVDNAGSSAELQWNARFLLWNLAIASGQLCRPSPMPCGWTTPSHTSSWAATTSAMRAWRLTARTVERGDGAKLPAQPLC